MVLVEEGSHADVRFALEHDHDERRAARRAVSVIVFAAESSGTARRTGVVGTEGVAEMVDAALTDAKAAPPAEDAFPLVEPADAPAAGRAFSLPPEETDSSVLEPVLSSLSGAFARARARDVVLAGFAELDLDTLYLGSSTGLRLCHAQPTGAVSLVGRTTDGVSSAWVAAPTIAPSLGEMEAEIWRRLDWATRQIPLEAGRYEVILPPSGVADMMAMLAFGGIGGQDAEDGRTVFSKEGGGTRVGETVATLPFTLSSDPAEPGVECAPFVATAASSSEVSVFDNGLAIGRTDWLATGPDPLALPPCRRGALGRGHGALRGQPLAALRCRGRRVDRRHGGPDGAWTAAHLLVVHPGGRPGDAAHDGSDP